MLSAAELREKTEKELNELKLDLLQEQFNLRMQKGTGQLAKNHLMRNARRNVARVETILTEKMRAAQ